MGSATLFIALIASPTLLALRQSSVVINILLLTFVFRLNSVTRTEIGVRIYFCENDHDGFLTPGSQ